MTRFLHDHPHLFSLRVSRYAFKHSRSPSPAKQSAPSGSSEPTTTQRSFLSLEKIIGEAVAVTSPDAALIMVFEPPSQAFLVPPVLAQLAPHEPRLHGHSRGARSRSFIPVPRKRLAPRHCGGGRPLAHLQDGIEEAHREEAEVAARQRPLALWAAGHHAVLLAQPASRVQVGSAILLRRAVLRQIEHLGAEAAAHGHRVAGPDEARRGDRPAAAIQEAIRPLERLLRLLLGHRGVFDLCRCLGPEISIDLPSSRLDPPAILRQRDDQGGGLLRFTDFLVPQLLEERGPVHV
eukprot:scaffold1747_cov251-Pinguiococcus_pyrenoidosus.AAC.9